MFTRSQFVDREDTKFWPSHYFLGDALLTPERFAVGFIEYTRSVLTNRHLFSFSACPPDLSAYKKENYPGIAVSPIPAENFAIPERCTVSATTTTSTTGDDAPEAQAQAQQVGCWPLIRGLERGNWVALVSHEWYVSPEVDRQQPRPACVPWGYDAEASFVRYAFIRTRRHITLD